MWRSSRSVWRCYYSAHVLALDSFRSLVPSALSRANAVGVYSIGYSVAMVGMMVNSAVVGLTPDAAREYEEDPTRAPVTVAG